MNGDPITDLVSMVGDAIGGITEEMAQAWDRCAIEARELDLVDGVGRNWLLERNPYRSEDAA